MNGQGGLFNSLSAIMQGSQAGNAAMNGIVPSATQTKGSPQFYLKARDMLRREVNNLNGVIDQLFREAGTDDEMHAAIKTIMECNQKIQGVATTLESKVKERAQQQSLQQVGM